MKKKEELPSLFSFQLLAAVEKKKKKKKNETAKSLSLVLRGKNDPL